MCGNRSPRLDAADDTFNTAETQRRFWMSSGLLALIDDIVALAKIAAISLDDVGAQVTKAGSKAAGIVIDDAAVTPRYVVGFAADRELPIVAKIAWGSLKNKMLYLLPAALALSAFAPWAMTPLLMVGGAFLCFEGYEKVHETIAPPSHDRGTQATEPTAIVDAKILEDEKVAGAIRTDMILSAEIMAISLASIATPTLMLQAVTLAAVGLAITVIVYGAVALIVKVDDAGLALARSRRPLAQTLGRSLVRAMPQFLKMLSLIGTFAMLWVGGGIIVHGLAEFGLGGVEHAIKGIDKTISDAIPGIGRWLGWFASASLAGLIGLALGWLVVRAVHVGRSKLKQRLSLGR
jgi:uncharacterized protein